MKKILLFFVFLIGCSEKEIFDKKEIFSICESFFELCKKNPPDAWYETHEELRKNTKREDFLQSLRFHRITKMNSFEVISIKPVKEILYLDAQISFAVGEIMPVRLRMAKEKEKWKILFIDFDLKTLLVSQGMVEPDLQFQKNLFKKTFDLFVLCTKKHNMREFHQTLSSLWKDFVTPQDLEKNYSPFMQGPFLEASWDEYTLRLDAKNSIQPSGILFLGATVHGAMILDFQMEFIWEEDQFRPLSLSIVSK